ncbi:MAG: YchJ family metal-binding protein [Bdellovibrionales bacterium]
MSLCPCGSNKDFASCCEPYLKGQPVPTAESLMRSRYSAHVMGNIDHLERTYTIKERGKSYRENIKRTIDETKWLGLEILSTKDGGKDDQTGQVEYAYRYVRDGQAYLQQELGNFLRENGSWLFKDSVVNPKSGPLETPKTGRNEACPCGSGKKFKKCCGSLF